MSTYIRNIHATGIYERIDLKQTFQSGINIIHGKNGAGKTTLLHILANALDGKYERFVHLPFKSIQISLSDETGILIKQTRTDQDVVITVQRPGTNQDIITFSLEEIRRNENAINPINITTNIVGTVKTSPKPVSLLKPPLPTSYFPAFRTMIEAWKPIIEEERSSQVIYLGGSGQVNKSTSTTLARRLFGLFVPEITYPSPRDISQSLVEEYTKATIKVANTNNKLLSQAFREIFVSLSEKHGQIDLKPEAILRQIQSIITRMGKSTIGEELIPDVDIVAAIRKSIESFQLAEGESTAANILDVYRRSLDEISRVQERAFDGIKRYLEAVNELLEGKKLYIPRTVAYHASQSVQIKFANGSFGELQSLSSGERQIVTMITRPLG